MKKIAITLTDPSGLHARPATELVKLLKTFTSTVTLEKGEKSGNAKSLIQILKIGISQGDTVTFTLDGSDENEAAASLEQFFGGTP